MIEKGLRDYMAADAGVAALLGANIFPHEAPQNVAEPFLIYAQHASHEPRGLDGKRLSQKYVYELTCCHTTFDAAKTLAAAVKNAVGGSTGTAVQTTLDGDNVVMFWDENPENDGHVSAKDVIRHNVRLELIILVK